MIAAIPRAKRSALRSRSDNAALHVAHLYSALVSLTYPASEVGKLTIQRGIRLRLVHAKPVPEQRTQLASGRDIVDSSIDVVDDECVGCRQQRRGGSFKLVGIPSDGAGLLDGHIARDGICGIIEAAGRDDIDGRWGDEERGVVPGEGHEFADTVVGCFPQVGLDH